MEGDQRVHRADCPRKFEDLTRCECTKAASTASELFPAQRLSFQVGSPPMQEVFRQVLNAAASEATLLILGETGTGKELVARAVHERSARRARRFAAVNTAALAESVLESELFGHEKGAFTGSTERRIGIIEAASGGTLFLDEIGDMPLHFQVKLLRVIESREVQRVGASVPVPVDVRIIAATNKNLEALVREGKFREDLYFRLYGVQIELPPLRNRLADLEILVHEFLASSPQAVRKGVAQVSAGVLGRFRSYAWPGNLRQLRNFVDAMMVQDGDGILDVDDLPGHVLRLLNQHPPPLSAGRSADEVLKRHVFHLLGDNHWHYQRTAEDLGIDRKTLRKWLKKWGVAME
jgi:transcriptional regulator with PAS, ATPase and Fis domain